MAEQRPTFRFRFPWMIAPRPIVATPPPTQPPTTQTPTQPTTATMVQRPPFRPPGIAPTQPPSTQAQPPSPSQSRTASQPASPSRVVPGSQVASQSQPTPQTAPQPSLPSLSASQPGGQTSSPPPSLSLNATQVQQTDAVIRPPSPPKLQTTTQESTQPPISREPPSPLSRQELKPTLSQPESQDPQTRIEITSETLPTSQSHVPVGKTIQPNGQAAQPSKELKPPAATAVPIPIPTRGTPSTDEINGKQTRAVVSHPKDKSMVYDSRQRPAISNGERIPLHREIRDDIAKFVHRMATGHLKEQMGEKTSNVVTLAGENRGASMHLGSESAKSEGTVHIRRVHKVDPDESAEATVDGEGSSKGKAKEPKTKEVQTTKAYINGNIQAVNNSMLFNGSITGRNPGVHLVLSRNRTEPIKSNERTESLESHKAEFNITPAQKLTYEPTVGRRCLRGLFLEPSDSDPDNPEKPRLHGCHYGCKENRKDNEIDIA